MHEKMLEKRFSSPFFWAPIPIKMCVLMDGDGALLDGALLNVSMLKWTCGNSSIILQILRVYAI